MIKIHESIITLFKIHYPDVNPYNLDKDLLVDMIQNMMEADKEKFAEEIKSDELIDDNYEQAHELIPEMLIQSDLIYLNGKLNGLPVNILFDSGCQVSTSFKSIIQKAELEHLVDKKARTYCSGVTGITETFGTLWFTELELEVSPDKFISIPIKLSICNDDEKNNKINEICEKEKICKKNSKTTDVLFGIDFMKAYKALVDFNKKTITLNNDIIIHYK